jgi:hypothetical protein
VLTPGGPVGLRMVRPEPRNMSKREMGRVGEFEPAIVAPRNIALGIAVARQVCADGQLEVVRWNSGVVRMRKR